MLEIGKVSEKIKQTFDCPGRDGKYLTMTYTGKALSTLGCMIWMQAFAVGVSGETKYEVNADMFPWTTAKSLCTLATPQIMTSSAKNMTVVIGDMDGVTLSEGEELWVGYVRRPELLQYIGCMAYDVNEERLALSYSTQRDLGQCVSRCNMTRYVAVMRTECYCMDTLPSANLKRTTCDEVCTDDSGVLCGGRASVSIYEVVKLADPSVIKEHRTTTAAGNCVAYNGNSKEFTYTRCTLSFSSKCLTDTGSVSMLTGYMSWKTMVTECIEAQLSPIDYATAEIIMDPYNIWTGLIRTSKVTSYKENTGGTMLNATDYGYVRYQNGEFYLHFEGADSSMPKSMGYICQEDTTTAAPMTTRAQPVQSADTNLVALYVLLPVLVIIIIAIIIFFIIRRRRRQGKEILSKWYQKRKSQAGINNQMFLEAQAELKKSHAHAHTNGDVPQTTILAFDESNHNSGLSNGHDYNLPDDDKHSGLIATIPLDNDVNGDVNEGRYNRLDNPVNEGTPPQKHYDKVPMDEHVNGLYDNGVKVNGKPGLLSNNDYAKIHKMKKGQGHPDETYNVLKTGNEPVHHIPPNSTYATTRFGTDIHTYDTTADKPAHVAVDNMYSKVD